MSKIKSILAFAALMLCGGAWAGITVNGSNFTVTNWESSNAATAANRNGYSYGPDQMYFVIPSAEGMPIGSIVRLTTLKIAVANDTLNENNTTKYINLNGRMSGAVNGTGTIQTTEYWGRANYGEKQTFTFDGGVELVVGTSYRIRFCKDAAGTVLPNQRVGVVELNSNTTGTCTVKDPNTQWSIISEASGTIVSTTVETTRTITANGDTEVTITEPTSITALTVNGTGNVTIHALDANGNALLHAKSVDASGLSGKLTIDIASNETMNAGANELVYNFFGEMTATAFTHTGAFTKGGTGTVAIHLGMGSTSMTVTNGILKRPSGNNENNNDASQDWNFNNKTVTVKDGATFDLNGGKNKYIKLVIQGNGFNNKGAVCNSVSNAATSNTSIAGITLEGDAKIDLATDYAFVSTGYAIIPVELGTYTLTKTGAGKMIMTNVKFTGTGTVYMSEGEFKINDNGKGEDFVPEGTLEVGADTGFASNGKTFKVKNLKLHSRRDPGTSAGTIKVPGLIDLSACENIQLNQQISSNGILGGIALTVYDTTSFKFPLWWLTSSMKLSTNALNLDNSVSGGTAIAPVYKGDTAFVADLTYNTTDKTVSYVKNRDFGDIYWKSASSSNWSASTVYALTDGGSDSVKFYKGDVVNFTDNTTVYQSKDWHQAVDMKIADNVTVTFGHNENNTLNTRGNLESGCSITLGSGAKALFSYWGGSNSNSGYADIRDLTINGKDGSWGIADAMVTALRIYGKVMGTAPLVIGEGHSIQICDGGSISNPIVSGADGKEVAYNATTKTYSLITAVAKVGSLGYETLSAAISAAAADETVELLANSTETITLTKDLVISVADGKELSVGTISSNYNVTKKGLGTLTMTHNVDAEKFVDVVEGTLKMNLSANYTMKGRLYVRADAKFVNMRTDAFGIDTDGARADIYGTLDMNGTRWTLGRGNNANDIYFYPGSSVIGLGQEQYGALDNASANKTHLHFVKNNGQGGEVTFNTEIRFRSDNGNNAGMEIEAGMMVNYVNANGFRSGQGTLNLTGGGSFKVKSGASLQNLSTLNIGSGVTAEIDSGISNKPAIRGVGTFKLAAMPDDSAATAYGLTDTGWMGTVDIANEVVNTTSTPLCIKLEKLGNASSTILWHGGRATGAGGLYLTGGTGAKVAAKIKLAGDFFFNNGGSGTNYYLGEIDGNNDADCDISFLTWRNNDGVGASYHVDKLSNFAGKITATRYTTISELALNSMPTANQKILTFGEPNDSYHTSKDSFAITSITVNGEVKDFAYEIRQDDGVYIVAVAQVGDNTYLSFAEAFEAAGEGGTVKLAGNTSASISIPAGKKLDVNGYVASGAITYGEGAYLIENGKPKINGCATSFDVTFNTKDTAKENGHIDYQCLDYVRLYYDSVPSYINETAESGSKTMGVYLKHHPYVHNLENNNDAWFKSTDEITLAVVGQMPKKDNTIFLHMGRSATKNGLFLATGTNTEEVVICYNKLNAITEVTRMTVPNARAARHTYVVTKHDDPEGTPNRKTTFTVYLDGEEWNTVQFDHFIITGGVQVGKPYGTNFSGWNIVENNENSANYDGESYINVIRIYDRVITEAEIKQYSVVEEYPYNSPNGNFERSNWADTNWKASDAWTKTSVNPQENSDLPLKGIVTATFAGNTEVIVNQTEKTNYEKLTIDGTGTITFTCGDGATAIKSIATVVNTPIIINKDSLDLSSGPTKLGTNGAITFNFAALSSENWERDLDDPLTGQMTSSENIRFVAPTDPKIYAQLVYENKVYRIRARLYAALYNGTYYLDVVDALTAAGENITDVVIINGSKVLPDGYRDYAVADDGHIVTTVNARTETKGFVSLAAAAVYCEEGDVIELLADDTSAVVLNKNITIDNSADRTVSGVISGAFSVTKTGSGKLKLTGGNTFTGALQIDAGVAEISTTSSGYDLVLNGGAIKAAVSDAHSTLIKSLTLEKDSAFGSSSDKCGVVGLGTGEGGASTLNLKGHKLDIWSSNNVYFESTTVTPSAGTIHLHSGNLLTHHAPLDLTGSKLIVDSGATIEIDGADNGITVTDLEYNGNESKGGTGGIKVLGNLSGTGTIKYLTLSGAVTVSGSVIVSTTLSTTDGTSIGFADGATLTTAGNYTTQGISGNGTLIVSGGTITAKNKPSGYAVDDATVQIDGGTFTVNLGNGDPQIRNAKFVINGGELKTYGWVTMVGTIELDAASDTTIFGSSTYNPSFRGTPNIIKSGDGTVTIKAGVDTGAKFSSLTLNGGSLTLTADVVVDSLVSGVAHKTVHYDSATRTYSLVGPIATVDGVDCFTKEDLAAHPQGTLVILNSDRVTINGNQVLVDGEALSAVTVEDMVLSPTAEETPGLRISEICPKLTLWDENHRDAGWLEVVNNGTAYANLKDYNIARFNRGKKVNKVTDWKCGVDVWIAPGARAVIKTSEDYPNADDKQITRYGADLNNALVLGAKINPKKYPVVVLAKGGKVVQNCVVPVDVPENKSVCYDGSKRANNANSENGATVSYITTATKGSENDFTGAVAVGPQVTSLYGVADAPDPWTAFPKAQLSTDYTVKLPVNTVYGLSEAEDSPDRITKVQLIYQIGFTTPVTNDTEMVKSAEKDATKGWLYTGTIPASALTTSGQVVKFAVKITDGAGNEWRSPSFNNPEDGFQWYGTIIEPTAEQTDGGITTLHIFADPDEVADTPGSDHSSATVLMNIDADNASYKTQKHPYGAYVGIYDNDTGMYYDSVRIDRRGNTTGKFTKKAHGLKFAKAQPFTGKDSVSGKTIECRKSSLTAEYADPAFVRQGLSFKVLNDNGSPAPFHYPVRLNLNGAFYQLAFHTERFSDELIEDFYGLDPKGYGYKNIGSFNPGLTPVSGGIEKKTPDDGVASDNGVLDAFCRKMEACELISEAHTEGNPIPTSDSEFETEFSAELTKVVTTDFDLPAWLNYIALTKITGETDDVWANLSGYYDVNGTGTWMPLAYDMNQSFGQWHKSDDPNMVSEMATAGKNCANYDHFKAHPLYGGLHIMVHYSGGAPYSAANNGTTARKPYKGNRCYEAIFQNAKYRRLYLRRLRTLMDAEFGGASADQDHTPIYQRAKAMVERYSAVAAKDRAIWTNYETSAQELWVFGHEEDGWTAEEGLEWMWTNYIEPRREHLYVTHAAEGHEGQIGYGETLCAGIPAAQSDINTLKDNFAVEWDATHQAVVLKNKNAEAVDVSGWAVAGRIAFVFPAGTVIDQGTEEEPGTLYITADRKATVASFGNNLHDQIIIGNGTANADVEAIVVRTNTGLRILGNATDQETSIRFESIYGNTTGDGDTGEWFTLKNIGEAAVNLEGMTVCILKDGDPESGSHCHVTFDSKSKVGSLAAGASKTFNQADWTSKGWPKIQNNKLNIKLYDKYGINYQTLAVTQKDYPIAYGKGAYLVADSTEVSVAKGEWHQVYDAAVQGDLTLKDWTKDKDSFNAMDKDLTVLVNDTVTIDLQNPTFGKKASLKIKGSGVATIKGTATKTNGTGTVINSEGSLVFEDGAYTFTTENDCIQADGDITINGGTFICHSTGNDGIDANGNIIINGGTIFAFTAANEAEEGADPQYSTGLDVNTGHTITINGGTVIATSAEATALSAMTITGQTNKIVEVSDVSGATKAIGDVIVTFPTMDPAPTAVLVSTSTLTEETEVTPANPDMVEIVAAVDGETPTPAVQATVPASWVADKEGDAKVAAAEAFVLGLAEPTEKPMVSSEQTAEADSIRIVDNVAPRYGTGVTVKRTLFVGTTPGEEAADTSIEETNGGFTVPLPTEGSKVKYIKIKYSFK